MTQPRKSTLISLVGPAKEMPCAPTVRIQSWDVLPHPVSSTRVPVRCSQPRIIFHYGGRQSGVPARSIVFDQYQHGASVTGAFDALAHAGYAPDAGCRAGFEIIRTWGGV